MQAAEEKWPLVVEAELTDPGMQAPLPGFLYVLTLMRYQVVKVLTGSYDRQVLFAAHPQADLSDPIFRAGVHHRLNLTTQFPEHASLLNKFGEETLGAGVFYCPSFEVID